MLRDAALVARNVAWLGAGEVGVKLGVMAAALIVARGMGAGGMGTFTVAYGAALVGTVVLALGQVEVLVRETAARPGEARGLLAAARRLQGRAALWLVPALAAGALLVDEAELRWTLATFLIYGLLRARLVTLGAAFKGLDRMDVEVKARGLEVGVALPLVAVAAGAGLGPWATGAAFSLGAGCGLVWLRGRVTQLGTWEEEGRLPAPTEGTERPPWPRAAGSPRVEAVPGTGEEEAAGRAARLLREGWPFLGLALLLQLVLRGDVFLLEALGQGREEIGVYGAAVTVVWGVLAVPQLLALAVYPALSRRAALGGRPARAGLGAAALGLAVGGIAAGALWLAREPLVRLAFGAEYAPAAPLLGTLAWALPGACTAMVLGTVLAAWHRQRLNLVLHTVALVAALAGNLYWIPLLGAPGAARVAVGVHTALGLALVTATAAARRPQDR